MLCILAAPSANQEKRVDPLSEATWYNPGGPTACGSDSPDIQYLVALSTQEFENGAHCGQYVGITANGITEYGQVADVCPSCSELELDLSAALFEEFAPLDVGVIEVSWNFEPAGFDPPA